jgi:hypothetical protein
MKAGQMVGHQLQGSVGVTVRLAQFPAQNANNCSKELEISLVKYTVPKSFLLFIGCCKLEPM